ncbi:MAG: NAD(P)H-hydrate dehydratase, partial [Clostridia bacterium]|nr:NAD(P)H-hydrate dehydratase [Clostridia bacterium]
IDDINKMNKYIISIDIPSGLEGDGAKPEGSHFSAVYTLAIGCKKPVHVMKNTSSFCGKTLTVDIGFDKDLYGITESFECTDDKYIKSVIVKRENDSHKGTYGKLLTVTGSKNMPGAAVLCANAAVLSGAGLVTCAFPSKAYPAIAPKITEPTMLPVACDDKGFTSLSAEKMILMRLAESSAAVIGCGLGVTEETSLLVYSVIKNAKCPLVIDADGINAVSLNINILKTAKAPLVLTPHPGEMATLTGLTVEKIQSDRINVCKKFAEMSNAVVVLKGSNTVIAQPGGKVYVNPTGNAGMAKGGCGDMLSGIIGSFLAQGMDAADAAAAGVYIHGLCGDVAVKDYSLTGLTPSIMLDYLPKLFSDFE